VSGATERERWGLPREGELAVGLALGGADDAAGWRSRLAAVELAERWGLHSVWVPEMHFARGGTASPLTALAAFSARSRRLRLGTTSLLLPIHDPLRLAEEVAQLDALSGGRVILGLGRGFRTPLFDGFGVDARVKRDRFDESLELLRRAWRGEAVSLEGTHFAGGAPGASLRPALCPLQQPHPPLCVAAFGPKGLDQAARHGLPYLASPVETLEALAENYARHAEGARAAGRVGRVVVPVMRTVHVAADDAEARRVLTALEGEWRALAGRGGRAPRALTRASEAPPEERVVVGTAARVIDALGVYRERLGLDLLVVRGQVPGAGDAEREASLERLLAEVLPALHR
jgi:alkanesulfonate monooxygenase SsuD/methylene tetrahydromethanopterin reductase-like flavin-dependent oxidoreductase (luciferase family)